MGRIKRVRGPEQAYFLDSFIRSIKRHAPGLIALICIALFTLSFLKVLWPNMEAQIALVGVMAIVATLYDMRVSLESGRWPKGTTLYPSMREARPKLVALLAKEIGNSRKDDIVILGTRFRSIADILREVRTKANTSGAR